MSSDVSLHVLYKIANAPIQPYPFPHIFVRDVFPQKFYEEILHRLPPKDMFTTLKSLGRVADEYPDTRFVLPFTPKNFTGIAEPFRSFWSEVAGWMLGGGFGSRILPKFGQFLAQRFGDLDRMQFYDEALLVQDYTTYSLGPHTDSPTKVMSFLYYLPSDESQTHLGTTIYAPKDPQFLCAGGPHHPFELFRRVYTMPYLPNSLFAFLKTENSFHGVEPVTGAEVRRDLLLYDIKVQNPPGRAEQPSATQAKPPAPVEFSF